MFTRGHWHLPVGGVIGVNRRDMGTEIILGVRPEALRFVPPAGAPLSGRAVVVEPRGPQTVVTVEIGGVLLKVLSPTIDCPAEASDVGLPAEPGSLVLFSGVTGRRLIA